jgi:hypothetical protein
MEIRLLVAIIIYSLRFRLPRGIGELGDQRCIVIWLRLRLGSSAKKS